MQTWENTFELDGVRFKVNQSNTTVRGMLVEQREVCAKFKYNEELVRVHTFNQWTHNPHALCVSYMSNITAEDDQAIDRRHIYTYVQNYTVAKVMEPYGVHWRETLTQQNTHHGVKQPLIMLQKSGRHAFNPYLKHYRRRL